MTKRLDQDVLALKRAVVALNGCTSREMVVATLEFLNDRYIKHPSGFLPKRLLPKPSWVCEFCFVTVQDSNLPSTWDLVLQSAVCPDCQKLVAIDGGYSVVRGGAYAYGKKDPRA